MRSRPAIADVIVAGGGPAGAAMATRLARTGRRVILAERSAYDRTRMGETLPAVVTSELRELGVLDAFMTLDPVPSVETASAWGDGAAAARSCIFDPYGHGWHVDRARFDAMLAECATAAGATVVRQAQVGGVSRADDDALALTIDRPGGRAVVRARHVVDATGRAARVARSLGATSRRLDQLVAVSVVCVLPPEVPNGDTFVESTPDGWWYVSPLPGRRRIISLFTDASIARSTGLADPSAWWTALHRTGHVVRLARQASPTSRPTVASAGSRFLTSAVGDGWIAVGDAALAVDPLSSSGVATALISARMAADVLAAPAEAYAARAAAYEAWLAEAAARYVRSQARYYGLEDRFADSPFWRARRAIDAGLGTASASSEVSRAGAR